MKKKSALVSNRLRSTTGKNGNMGYKLTDNIGYSFLFVRRRFDARQEPS